jgi:ribosomal protein S14
MAATVRWPFSHGDPYLAQDYHTWWQCATVRAAVCGSARGSVRQYVAVCGSARGNSVYYGSAHGSARAVRAHGSVRQYAWCAVCGSASGSVRLSGSSAAVCAR